jgi:hypothetical protein
LPFAAPLNAGVRRLNVNMTAAIQQTTSTKRRLLTIPVLLGAACVLILLLYPFKYTVVPEWKFQVVYKSGKPVPNIRVREVWQHYSLEKQDHEAETVTNAEGYAVFPERTIKANTLQRFLVAVTNAPWIVHASWGPHSYLIVLAGPDYLNGGSYDGKGAPPERIELLKMSEIPPLENYESIIN